MDSEGAYALKNLSDKVKRSPKAQLYEETAARGRIIFGIAAIFFLASALFVNISTWVSNGLVRHPSLLISLDVGIATLFFVFVAFERWRWRMLAPKKYALTFPRWARVVLAILFIYAVTVWVFDRVRSRQNYKDNPLAHSSLQLEISAEKQMQNQTRMIRNVSNFWILFSSISAVGLLLVKHKEHEGPFGKFNSIVR